ncbi:hypothetical protein BU25DRAFT_448000 [Macroventuria anomochaeta]|uniref:Uncharacterized protein n=1 Tax=Macroventuria anomochaeta TaxID=301207 RepID=A0ACB6S2P6_9PLEO|nr:uncharacterized protein BU25DRAFT_448000 [Macroventuria anomochaeta]KAF2628550.1 hypothetical protein BU25DRAFT_448000 [Macroventuria anomochaeta]
MPASLNHIDTAPHQHDIEVTPGAEEVAQSRDPPLFSTQQTLFDQKLLHDYLDSQQQSHSTASINSSSSLMGSVYTETPVSGVPSDDRLRKQALSEPANLKLLWEIRSLRQLLSRSPQVQRQWAQFPCAL